ncbi:MAG: exodeoxyribonuclease VII large subunit [Candidatus Competibacteraceae bacterium]
MNDLAPTRTVYTVSRLNQEARYLLEDVFPTLWVQGEVSNLSRPGSGHLYFSLKDASAQLRCALFQNRALLFRDCPRNGQQVLARGRVSLYESRGEFQLIVEFIEEAGAGALRQAYDALRLRLEQEGLFASSRKKPLPRFPHRIGVITSPTGAALRDVLTTLRRRCPQTPVLLYPVPVQGDGAAERIAAAIRLASKRRECAVLLLVRGGGALEDLQAFNAESVARAIADCAIPLVSGVGHETDVTIADFAADLRAATPTAAAELASPDRQDGLRQLQALDERLAGALRRRLENQQQRLEQLAQRLTRQHPQRRVRDRAQRLDELEQRLRQALRRRLHTAARSLRQMSERLHTLSPLATLQRGYAIVRRYPEGAIVRRASEVQVGDAVEALLDEGCLRCEIKAVSALDSWPESLTHHQSPGC